MSLISNAQPSNNNCGSATPLTVNGACVNGTNVAATVQAVPFNEAASTPSCWLTAPNNTVWYSVTPSTTGVHVISLDNGGTFDSQLQVYSGTCASLTPLADGCSEDNGSVNTVAAVATPMLTAGVTYLIQVDGYNTSTGTFCISITYTPPAANDCIFNAINITSQINGISTTNLFDCTQYTYNPPGPGNEPTSTTVTGDPNGCNGTGTAHYDVWFSFTVSGSTPPTWLSIYQSTGTTPNYAAAVYSGTPTGTCGSAVGGLTQFECSSGEIINVPPGNESGGTNDEGPCSTPLHPRIDISSLAPGTYYLRVWEFGGYTPVSEGTFNLCAEYGLPSAPATDGCPGISTVACAEASANQNVVVTYYNTGNNASHGNACNTASGEPQLVATAAGQYDELCDGSYVIPVAYTNNVMNNTAIYQFNVNSFGTCQANVSVQMNNIQYGGTNGNVAQMQVMNGACAGGTSAVMTATTNQSCITMTSSTGTLPNGNYFIVVDGQDGQLLQYDMQISVTYSGVGCTPGNCDIVLGSNYLSLNGTPLDHKKNMINWQTKNEFNNDYYTVEKSLTGLDFEAIGSIDGAGTTNEESAYDFIDEHATQELSYYRLRQVDYDGQVNYTPIIAVKKKPDNYGIQSVYPDVVNDRILGFYTTSKPEFVTYSLINLSGLEVQKGSKQLNEGMNTLIIDSPGLSAGTYTLIVTDSKASYSIKFVMP